MAVTTQTKIIAVPKEKGTTTIINRGGSSGSGSNTTAPITPHYLWG